VTKSTPNHSSNFQKTIKRSVSFSGKGVFTAGESRVTLHSAEEDAGIFFLVKGTKIPALAEYAQQAVQGFTVLENKNLKVQTVEHLLSALYALGIDNVCIEVEGSEIPMMDGSAKPFADEIVKAGFTIQSKKCAVWELNAPLMYETDQATIIALPSDTFRISYTWHCPKSKKFQTQFASVEVSAQSFCEQISAARTFAFYEDLVPAIEAGLIQGANLDQGILIQEDAVVNKEGLRFEDELVRHKMLDLIGDFSLIGQKAQVHLIALRSGHRDNVAFARQVRNILTGEISHGSTIRQADFGCESSRQDIASPLSVSSR